MKIKSICTLTMLVLTASIVWAQSVTRCGGPNTALYINWPTFGFDVCHTGYNPYEYILNTGNVQNLTLGWKWTPPPPDLGAPSSPAVVNGNVYFGTGQYVYALSATTGTMLWRYPINNANAATPAVVNGVVYFGSNLYVIALKATTGELLWRQSVGRNIQGSPTVVDGVLYIGSQVLGNGYYINALNATTGVPVWTDTVSTDTSASTPAVVNGVVYIAGGSVLYAVNAVTGAILWQSDQGGYIRASPTVFHGVGYIGGAAGITAVNAVTGANLWRYQTEDPYIYGSSSPAIANGIVYVAASFNYTDFSDPFGQLLALNASTGELIWSSPLGGPSILSPTVANGVVYVSVYGGGFRMFDAASGALLGYTQGGGGNVDSPPVVNGVLYGACDGQDVGALCVFHLPN